MTGLLDPYREGLLDLLKGSKTQRVEHMAGKNTPQKTWQSPHRPECLWHGTGTGAVSLPLGTRERHFQRTRGDRRELGRLSHSDWKSRCEDLLARTEGAGVEGMSDLNAFNFYYAWPCCFEFFLFRKFLVHIIMVHCVFPTEFQSFLIFFGEFMVEAESP